MRIIKTMALLVFCMNAQAHPVAQGRLDFSLHANLVHLEANLSAEEVLVEWSNHGAKTCSWEQKVSDHNQYFLTHLQVHANGVLLTGHVVGNPTNPTCEVDYALSQIPEEITLSQDVLNEWQSAPGLPWSASYIVTFTSGKNSQQGLLLPREPLGFYVSQDASHRFFGTFFGFGVAHILAGIDHLLFVAALLLASRNVWDLMKVVSVFTLAHTLTLALAALNVIRLPSAIVEPMIAASIVYVALQNIYHREQSIGKQRLAVAFGFGLFHGLGFAGGLMEAMSHMPTTHAIEAIGAFSLGVETGHQIVVLPLFFLLMMARKVLDNPVAVVKIGSAAITAAGVVFLFAALKHV